jgi:hypothetical protein
MAVKVTGLPAQIEFPGLALMVTDEGTVVVTLIPILLEMAGDPETQLAFEVITQVIVSPLFRAELENELPPVPTLVPFTFHWKKGVPPLTGVAVKLTRFPEQITFDGVAAIVTLAITAGVTTIPILLEVAGEADTQVALEVITQLIVSLLLNVVFV